MAVWEFKGWLALIILALAQAITTILTYKNPPIHSLW